jgi:Fe2+ or Zn2+ uptake regulation protein
MEKYRKILKENKLKVTPKRVAIIKFFLKNKKYASAFDVHHYLKNNFKKIGLPTVYRNLDNLTKIGIFTKFELDEKNLFYYGICDVEKGTHHHHIICERCHKISSFDLCNFESLRGDIEKKTGFSVSYHNLFLKGVCKDCQETMGGNR